MRFTWIAAVAQSAAVTVTAAVISTAPTIIASVAMNAAVIVIAQKIVLWSARTISACATAPAALMEIVLLGWLVTMEYVLKNVRNMIHFVAMMMTAFPLTSV